MFQFYSQHTPFTMVQLWFYNGVIELVTQPYFTTLLYSIYKSRV